jgi:hypothetical protein
VVCGLFLWAAGRGAVSAFGFGLGGQAGAAAEIVLGFFSFLKKGKLSIAFFGVVYAELAAMIRFFLIFVDLFEFVFVLSCPIWRFINTKSWKSWTGHVDPSKTCSS